MSSDLFHHYILRLFLLHIIESQSNRSTQGDRSLLNDGMEVMVEANLVNFLWQETIRAWGGGQVI